MGFGNLRQMGVGRWNVALGAAALAAGFAVCAPAQAFDDRASTLEPLWNILGVGKDGDEKPDIDFRERPKLVVPKTKDLPPPQATNANRPANWPTDPNVARRRDAEAAARGPRTVEINTNPIIRKPELLEGRTTEPRSQNEICEGQANLGTPDCSTPTAAEKLKRVFGGGQDKDVLVPGREPDRTYLTEPPRGYRAATRAVAAEKAKPVERPDYSDPKQYLRDQNRQRYLED